MWFKGIEFRVYRGLALGFRVDRAVCGLVPARRQTSAGRARGDSQCAADEETVSGRSGGACWVGSIGLGDWSASAGLRGCSSGLP